jgi:thymidylate kinase
MGGLLVALEGPSASGKSRTARAVARRVGGIVLPEAVDRMHPRPSIDWRTPAGLLRLEQRLLREDGRRYRFGRLRAERGRCVVADTGFLGAWTYTAGLVALGLAPRSVLRSLGRAAAEEFRRGRLGVPDGVVYLRTSPVTRARRRARDRLGHPVTLDARHQAVGAVERRWFRQVLAPRLGGRYREVDANGRPEEVATRVERIIARWSRDVAVRPRGGPRALLRLPKGVP